MALVLPLIGIWLYMVYSTESIALELRRESVYQFYERYCQADGKLQQQYLDEVYGSYENLQIHGEGGEGVVEVGSNANSKEGSLVFEGTKREHRRVHGQHLDFNLIDTEDSVKEILKAYDAMYWLFNETATYRGFKAFAETSKASKFLLKPFPEGGVRVPRDQVLETGALNWCVAHAFSEKTEYIGKIQAYNTGYILVSAILLTVIGPSYILPPDFDNEYFGYIYTGLLGISTFVQLFNLVAFTAVGKLIDQPYVPSMTMLARVEAEFYLVLLNYFVYIGVFLFMIALLFVAYVGSTL
jgi:hypothetical protein